MGKLYDVSEIERSFTIFGNWVGTQAPVLERLRTAFSEYMKSSSQFTQSTSATMLNALILNTILPVYTGTINLVEDYRKINSETRVKWYEKVTADSFFYKHDLILSKRDVLSTSLSQVINTIESSDVSLTSTIELKNYATNITNNFSAFDTDRTTKYIALNERSKKIVQLSNSLMNALKSVVVDGKIERDADLTKVYSMMLDENGQLMQDVILIEYSGLSWEEINELENQGIPQDILYRLIASLTGPSDREGLRKLLDGNYEDFCAEDPANYSEGLFMLTSYYMSVNNVDLDATFNDVNSDGEFRLSDDYEKFINEVLKGKYSQGYLYNLSQSSNIIANENADRLLDLYINSESESEKKSYMRESNFFTAHALLYSQLFSMDDAIKHKLEKVPYENLNDGQHSYVNPKFLVIKDISFFLDDLRVDLDRSYMGQIETTMYTWNERGNMIATNVKGEYVLMDIIIDENTLSIVDRFSMYLRTGEDLMLNNIFNDYSKAKYELKNWNKYGEWYTLSGFVGSIITSKVPILGSIYNDLITEGVINSSMSGPTYQPPKNREWNFAEMVESIRGKIDKLSEDQLNLFRSSEYLSKSDAEKSIIKEQYALANAALDSLLSYYKNQSEKENAVSIAGENILAAIWGSAYGLDILDSNYYKDKLSPSQIGGPSLELKFKAETIHKSGLAGWYSQTPLNEKGVDTYNDTWNKVLNGDGTSDKIALPPGVTVEDFRQLIFGYSSDYPNCNSLLDTPEMAELAQNAIEKFNNLASSPESNLSKLNSITDSKMQSGGIE